MSRKRRRALVVVHSYYARDTRPRRFATALVRAGWEVDVLCAREPGESRREVIAGVQLHRLPAQRKRGSKLRYIFEYLSFAMLALVAVTRMHVKRRYRAVHVIGIPNFIVFSALVPRLTGARVFLDMRDPLPEFYEAKFALAHDHPLIRALRAEERLSARFAGRVLTAHPTMAGLYRRTGLPDDRVTVIWNAPDPALFDGPAPHSDEGNRTMLYIGTVAPRYGVDLAVRAVARLKDDIPALRLRIVGDGDLTRTLQRTVRDEGIADRISFEAPVPLDRVPALVRECWLGVQPNREDPLMRTSFSQKILEWCVLGLPVVCGETEALCQTFTSDELLMHAPDDLDGLCARILEAHQDPEGLARRAGRARKAAERIRYEDQIARLISLFEGKDAHRYNSGASHEDR